MKNVHKLPNPYIFVDRNSKELSFSLSATEKIFHIIQGWFIANKYVCEKKANSLSTNTHARFCDESGPVINQDSLVQVLLEEGYVFENESRHKKDNVLILSFTDRSLSGITRDIACAIRGPYQVLVKSISDYRESIKSVVNVASINTNPITTNSNTEKNDFNSTLQDIVVYCSIRLYIIVKHSRVHANCFVILNYAFVVEKEIGTSWAVPPTDIAKTDALIN